MDFDVIVIGGGHAGCEAAHASAKIGCQTALITLNPKRIGFMSCNPAMGGLGKGQLIKEIDALGGVMGINTDKTAIQYRRLNESKGPAVRSSRAQCDKQLYAEKMQEFLAGIPRLTIISAEVDDLIADGRRVCGVRFKDGSKASCRAVVITSGTFLRAIMHTGLDQTEGGRVGDPSARGLSGALERLGFSLRRLKTGTPPRLHRRSIDFSEVERQPGDLKPIPFSFYFKPEPFPALPQVDCFITYTNPRTHEIIEESFSRSPLFTGVIQGVGPRYCPSIEDKVRRFRQRERHQIFLEPEGLNTDEVYVNGISTSLPKDVQERFVRTVLGLEQAEFIRFGYAVEYDSIDASQLRSTLESKDIAGLYFAGQINGTSGYEEAGAQGIVAGSNAAASVLGLDPLLISRSDGYIGVMIDDLITKGTDEPYRMFTSRAEYRLLLREDNAHLRLGDHGRRIGLLGEAEYRRLCEFRGKLGHWMDKTSEFQPGFSAVTKWFESKGLLAPKDRMSAAMLLRRPEVNWTSLVEMGFPAQGVSDEVSEQVEIQIKYEGYIRRDLELLEGVRKSEGQKIPIDLSFDGIPGLSNEAKSRLKKTRPETVGQASRMAGITPAAIANILIHLKLRNADRLRSSPEYD